MTECKCGNILGDEFDGDELMCICGRIIKCPTTGKAPSAQSPAAMAGSGAPEIERIKQEMTEKEQKVLDLIEQYGGIDGAHHKDWLLDQLARILTGEGYEAWVVELKSGEEVPLPTAMNKFGGEKECYCGRKFAMPFYLYTHIKNWH